MEIARVISQKRNITEETLKKHGLKKSEIVISLGDNKYNKVPALALPYIKGGNVVNHKYRALDSKQFSQDSNGHKCFWNYDAITDPALQNEPLFITEGEFDALSLIDCGYSRVISVPDGAPNEALLVDDDYEGVKYSYVEEAMGDLANVKHIILCTDKDVPGINLQNDLVKMLGPSRCKVIAYPADCKDLNEVLINYSKRGIDACVKKATWVPFDDLLSFDLIEESPDVKAYDIGIPGFEEHIKMRMGDFWVVTGIPSHGKTTFMNDLLCRVADKHGFKVCISSFEQDIKPDFRRALRAGVNQKQESQQSAIELAKADEWIQEHFMFIRPNFNNRTVFDLAWMLSRMAAASIRYGCKVFVIDPWNEIDHVVPHSMSLTEYVGQAIKELKRFAKRYDVCVIVVAHPAKPMMNKDNKLIKPNLYSISDSAHWYNKPDLGLVVHRDRDKGSSVTIAKSRYHDKIGKPGEVFVQYNPDSHRFMVDTERTG